MQVQLTQKGQQLAQQTEAIATFTSQRDQLDATAQAQSTSLQCSQKEVQAKAAQIQDLVTQLADQHQELQSTQRQLQQQKTAHSELESQLGTQTADLIVVSQRASNLEADKQQLQQLLDTAVLDQQQLQSRLEETKAAADKQSAASHEDIQQLQVTSYLQANRFWLRLTMLHHAVVVASYDIAHSV